MLRVIETDQTSLFLEYKETKSLEIRNKLVKLNVGLAKKIVRDIKQLSQVEKEDLEQVALVELIAAVERFDPEKGFKFSTFAVPVIRGRLLNFIRDKATPIKTPRTDYERVQKYKRVKRHLALIEGGNPSDDNIATTMGVRPTQLRDSLAALQHCRYTDVDSKCDRPLEKFAPQVVADLQSLKFNFVDLNRKEEVATRLYFLWGQTTSGVCENMGVDSRELKGLLRKSLENTKVRMYG